MTDITKAAHDAIAEFDRYFTSSNGVDVPERVTVSRDEWRALRAALQDKAGEGPAELCQKYERWLEFLHRPNTDAEGFEWGIARIKWVDGKAIALWTNQDHSDLEAEILRQSLKPDPSTSGWIEVAGSAPPKLDWSEPTDYATQPAPVVPDGFALVAVEPTDEMEAEAENHYELSRSTFPDWKAAYRAMIAASQQKGEQHG